VRPVVQHGHVAVQTQAVLRVQPVAGTVVQTRTSGAAGGRRRRHIVADAASTGRGGRGRGDRRHVAVRRVPAVPAVPATPAHPPVLLDVGQRVAAAAAAASDVPAVRAVQSVRAQAEHGHAVQRRGDVQQPVQAVRRRSGTRRDARQAVADVVQLVRPEDAAAAAYRVLRRRHADGFEQDFAAGRRRGVVQPATVARPTQRHVPRPQSARQTAAVR